MMSDIQEMYQELMEAINSIDEQLDSLDGGDSAGKRKIANDLVAANEAVWQPVVESLIRQLGNLEGDTLAGVFRGISGELNKAFAKPVADHIESLVEVAPVVEPLITAEEATELSSQRSELYKNVKQVIHLASVMNSLELESPKIRRGSKGKRGPRIVTLMNWAINGEALDDEIKYKEVAIACGFEGSKGLTDYMKSKDIDTKAPENNEIEVELPDGRTLTGFMPEDDDDDETTEEV